MTHNDFNKEDDRENKISFQVLEDGNTVRKEDAANRITTQQTIKPKKQRKTNWAMPVLLTIATAGVIGTVLGMFILQLFVDLDEDVTLADNEEEPEDTTTVTTEDNANSDMITEELPVLSSFVLQVGVFSEQSNAEKWQDFYKEQGEDVVIWERDNQYYLFIGIYGKEEQAKSRVEELQASNIDVFMKEWETREIMIPELTNEEMNWFHQFHDTWGLALTEKNEHLLTDLLEHIPSSTTLEALVKRLENPSEQVDEFFFDLMKTYESL